MTIESEVQIIDATIDKVTSTHIFLSTVTAHLVYKSAQFLNHRIDKLIPMSQPSVIIPSLPIPRHEIRRLPAHLQSRVHAEIKKQEGKK